MPQEEALQCRKVRKGQCTCIIIVAIYIIIYMTPVNRMVLHVCNKLFLSFSVRFQNRNQNTSTKEKGHTGQCT